MLALVVAATLGALTNSLHATEAVSLMADTQQNLRAGLNYMVRDLLQAGEGIPLGGITLPNSSGTSAVQRPGPGTPGASFGTFNTTWTALPAIISGYQLGPTTATSGVGSDMVTALYADTTLVDANGHWLNRIPNLSECGRRHGRVRGEQSNTSTRREYRDRGLDDHRHFRCFLYRDQ